eukprot:scaffold36291_cov22-Tisochrysis_lutea.AAC.2
MQVAPALHLHAHRCVSSPKLSPNILHANAGDVPSSRRLVERCLTVGVGMGLIMALAVGTFRYGLYAVGLRIGAGLSAVGFKDGRWAVCCTLYACSIIVGAPA